MPGARPRLRRGYPLHGNPSIGASGEAPTAPHATSARGKPKKLTGPARFWRGRGIRIALAATLAFSVVVHWFLAPWNLLPSSSGIEFKDPEGELSIPVDLLGAEEPPPPEPAPAPTQAEPTPNAPKDPTAPGKPDAGPKHVEDAGEKLAAIVDAGGAPEHDGGAPTDAGEAGQADGSATSDAGLVAIADAAAGPGSGGPREPESMFG
ncbi:MAG TPA: hypothetical protein VM925_23015, partial [Labilithrix sp.]|nr:hypothetical protein [Labilithrix sp.]